MPLRSAIPMALFSGGLALLAPQAARAQIDCSKAESSIDRRICEAPALLAQDRTLVTAFRAALQSHPGQADAIRLAQRQWLADRRRDCGALRDTAADACLARSFTTRIAALQADPVAPVAASPPPAVAAQAGATPATPPPTIPVPPATPVPPTVPGRTTTVAPSASAAAPAPAASAAAPVPAPWPQATPVAPAALPPGPAIPTGEARLRDETLPATGEAETLLEVTRPGRFAVKATSATGTALQLIDMLTGPGEVSGVAGAADGRLDLLLDTGTYKLRSFGAPVVAIAPDGSEVPVPSGTARVPGAAAPARLSVTPFRDAAPPAILQPGELASAELADGQQRGFWLRIDTARTLRIQAAGRSLTALHVWREGRDLLPAGATSRNIEPTPSHPLTEFLLEPVLEPGNYLIIAYGGPARPWADGVATQPFHLRLGASAALEPGWVSARIGPFGSEVYALSTRASLLRLEVPEPAEVALTVSTGPNTTGANTSGAEAPLTTRIARNSRQASAMLRLPQPAATPTTPGSTPSPTTGSTTTPPDSGVQRFVEVQGREGQLLQLRAFGLAPRLPRPTGTLWAAAEAPGMGGDEIPATALLLRRQAEQPPAILAGVAPRIGPGQAWRGRFNLRGQAAMLLEVVAPGPIALRAQGVALRATLQPVLGGDAVSRADGDTRPWDLAAGWYALRLTPQGNASGVLDLTVGPPGLTLASPAAPQPAGPVLPLGVQTLAAGQTLAMLGGSTQEGAAMLVLRPLPLDLGAAPLAVTQLAGPAPGNTTPPNPAPVSPAPASPVPTSPVPTSPGPTSPAAPGTTPGNSRPVNSRIDWPLGALPPGQLVAIGTNGKPVMAEILPAAPGRPASLRLPATTEARTVLLSWRPTVSPAASIVPQPLPALGALASGKPVFLDLARDESRSFAVDLAEGGLYRIETLGRLRTSGRLGSAFVAELDAAEANGTGQNLLIQRYLRAGRYRLSVSALASAGRLGVLASPAPLLQGAPLVADGTVRASLPAGSGIAFPLVVTEAGRYRLDLPSLTQSSLGAPVQARLEDAEGWPLLPAGALDGTEQMLQPGRYRLVVLPTDMQTRILARLSQLRPEPVSQGHGPHALAFETPRSHQWREPATREAPREPDLWDFTLAGPAGISLRIGDGMAAEIVRQEDATAVATPAGGRIAAFAGGTPFNGVLQAGRYRIRAMAQGRNDRLDYTLSLTSEALQPDVTRRVTLPAELPFAIAEDRVVSLSSFGATDLRATLRDDAGKVVLRQDDRTDDWNIGLSRLLPAGAYRLSLTATAPELPARRESAAGNASDEAEVPEGSAPDDAEAGSDEAGGEGMQADDEANESEASDSETGATPSPATIELRLTLPEARPEAPASLSDSVTLEGRDIHRLLLPALPADSLLLVGAQAEVEAVLSLERRDAGGRWQSVATANGLAPSLAVPAEPGAAWRASLWTLDGGAQPLRFTARQASPPALAPGTLTPQAVPGFPDLFLAHVASPGAALLSVAGEGLRAASAPGRPAIPLQGGLLAPQSGSVWILAESAAPLAITAPAPDAAFLLTLAEDDTATLPAPTGGPRLWLAEGGDAAVMLQAGHGMGLAPGSSAALATRDPLRLRAAGDGAAMATGTARVTLRAMDPVLAPEANVGEGFAGNLPPGTARPLRLPAGPKRLRLDLPAGGLAIADWQGAGSVTIWAGNTPVSRMLEGDWTDLLLVNAGTVEAPLQLSLAPLSAAPMALAPDRMLRRFLGAAGSLALPVQATPGQRLGLAGVTGASFLGQDGSLSQGAGGFVLSGPGWLVLEHPPGPVLAWLQGPGLSPWPAAEPQPLAIPAQRALAGAAMTLRLDPATPVLLHLRSTAPLVLALGDEPPTLFPAGAELHRYQPAGAALLRLMAAQDGPLSGALEVTATPVLPAGEGLGAPVLVGPGGSALFGFDLPRAGRIGLGLRAEPDNIAVRLLDATGKPLGEGTAQLRDLPAGRYLIEARVPADGGATRIRPALLGLVPRPDGPPPDLAQAYREMAAGTPDAPTPARLPASR